jgi:hypothetical protein
MANESNLSKEHRREGYPCRYIDKAGSICSAPLSICRVALLLLRQRRGAAGSGLGTQSSTCDAQRAAPRATAWTSRPSTCDAQRAAPRATAWAPRLSTCDKQRAALRATAWAPRSRAPTTHNKRRPGQRPGHHDQVPALRRGQRPGHSDQILATRNERRIGQQPGRRDQLTARRRGHGFRRHDQVPATHNEATAWAPRSSTCGARRAAPVATT